MPRPFRIGDRVRKGAHEFLVDTVHPNEIGITLPMIGGYCEWAQPNELELVCTCPHVSDGANGWRPDTSAAATDCPSHTRPADVAPEQGSK